MATRLKTIQYAMVTKATLTDNTLQAMTQMTLYLPEFSGTVTFKKVVAQVSVKEGATMTTGNYSSRRLDVSVGGAAATTYTNANVLTGSGENITLFFGADVTAHFVSNWTTGTSKTLDVSVLADGTHTTVAMVDVDVTLYITYEYDDTQTTQIKTVLIPLNAPVGALATTKPGTATATIPALNTELPEASKTIRHMHIVAQGNINNTASTVDGTVSMQIDSLTAFTSASLEMGATSDYWTRFVWNIDGLSLDTSVSHSFYIWAQQARFNHPQAYMVVTYEFNASTSTQVFNSVLLPNFGDNVGGTASTDFQRISDRLWIEEPGTITTKQLAFYPIWQAQNNLGGLNMRLGTGSFVTYTDGAGVLGGANGAMCRNDSAYTLARGKNDLVFDIYRTDTADWGSALNGFFIVNYTSDKPTQGAGAANHTVFWGSGMAWDGNNVAERRTSAVAPTIPETDYFMNCFGGVFQYIPNSTNYPFICLMVERTSSAGQWKRIAEMSGQADPEQGLVTMYYHMDDLMYRFASDPDTTRLDPETTRRYYYQNGLTSICIGYLDIIFTYHTITFDITGTISGSAGGTVNLTAFHTTLGKIATGSRVGDGSYTLRAYDDTEDIFVEARESSTKLGRSDNAVAT